jgi:hypothetical protein
MKTFFFFSLSYNSDKLTKYLDLFEGMEDFLLAFQMKSQSENAKRLAVSLLRITEELFVWQVSCLEILR